MEATQSLHQKAQTRKDGEWVCQGNYLVAKHTSLLRIESSHRNSLYKSPRLVGVKEEVEAGLESPAVF